MADGVSSWRILAASSPGEVRVAVMHGATLSDYAIWRPGSPDGVGDLHRGRVRARAPALAGSFVALSGSTDGFLPDAQEGQEASAGMVLAVRVTRAAQAGKGPRLTARLSEAELALAGTGAMALVRRGPSAIERFAAIYPDASVLVDDPALVASLRSMLGDRICLVPSVFDEPLRGEIAALAEEDIALPGGGRMTVQPTRALVAIDIDAGTASGERTQKGAAQRSFNAAMLPLLARQIRLRNLSGAIVVDLAGLSIRRRRALGPALEAALRTDPLQPRFLGFTGLGLAEIVRPRVHPPLHEMLAGPHAAGLAALRDLAPQLPGTRGFARLRATPTVVAALQSDSVALSDLARRTGRTLILQSDPTLPANAWRFETD